MVIIGVDYHPSFQAIAFCVEETGECGEQELSHSDGQAERFYRELKQRGASVRVGPGQAKSSEPACQRPPQLAHGLLGMPHWHCLSDYSPSRLTHVCNAKFQTVNQI